VNVETLIYGLIFGLVIGLVAWRLGIRRSPWREALAGVVLYVALSLSLMAAGVGSTESITIAVIGSALLVGAWKRFAHRTA
jgi:multisubunit Na+/H+ antiporter MnhE subunit